MNIKLKFFALLALCLSATALQATDQAFVHPGILHQMEDLNRIRQNVNAGTEPYASGFEKLKKDRLSSSRYKLQGPFAEVGRKPSLNNREHANDSKAAFQNAMMWVSTGEQAHADKAIEIINAWSHRLQKFTGKDAILAAGISGVNFAAAAEVLRYTETGWQDKDIAQAEKMFKEVYYPVCKGFARHANGNWGLACMQTVIAIAVFTNDREIFDRAVTFFHEGDGNARMTGYVLFDTGQCQETGRDQQHTMLGLGYLAVVAEIAWNQGLDLYGANDNRILLGFEYTAKYNLGGTVPFQPHRSGKYRFESLGEEGRGKFRARPIFEMVYYHYKKRKGIDCPYVEKVVQKMRPEGGGTNGDHLGFGTVLFAR